MRIPNMCLILKLDIGKVVSMENGQTDRQTESQNHRITEIQISLLFQHLCNRNLLAGLVHFFKFEKKDYFLYFSIVSTFMYEKRISWTFILGQLTNEKARKLILLKKTCQIYDMCISISCIITFVFNIEVTILFPWFLV